MDGRNLIVYHWADIAKLLDEAPSVHSVGAMLRKDLGPGDYIVLKVPEQIRVARATTVLPYFDQVWITRESGLETCVKNRFEPVQHIRLSPVKGVS